MKGKREEARKRGEKETFNSRLIGVKKKKKVRIWMFEAD